MTRGIRSALLAGLAGLAGLAALAVSAGATAAEDKEPARGEKVDGYAEWHVADGCLIADGQKVCPAPGFKFKGGGEAKDVASIPLGYELKAKGKRLDDGSLLALEIEAKPNGSAWPEGEVRSATDAAERRAREKGRFLQGADDSTSIGRLIEQGPYVERVRRIVDNLVPPYLHPEDLRIYVIENREWNAFAMGNYSIYVFTGLLDDMDDDEVAIVLGHELVHATHEHSRKQFKRDMIVQIIAAGLLGAASTIDDQKKAVLASLLVVAASAAYQNGYGRGMEDQADRVGMRYAYEAGYDITKGPRLWNRFAKKYGEGNKAVNFFFGDHSLSAARATKLEKEIAFNYPEGPKQGGAARSARRSPASGGQTAVAVTRVPPPAGAQALVAPAPAAPPRPPSPKPAAAAAPTTRTEIRRGMTVDEVKKALGDPQAEMVFGEKTRWTYPDLTVVFEKGHVTDVKF